MVLRPRYFTLTHCLSLVSQTNRTLRRWLLGGVLFGVHRHRRNRSIRIRAADILPICRYVSRFVRLLYVYDVRDLDSLFAHRGQYERCAVSVS